ncbi:MAG: protein translocase subunit SecD [Anaerovorax sp.]
MKKFLAVILAIVIILGWYITLFGLGPIDPLKEQMKLGLDLKGGVYVVMEAETKATGAELKKLMEQTQAVIEKRVNTMGLSEPVVTIEGDKKIRVELPGAEDAEQAIATIGKTAQLQFVLADNTVAVDGSMVKNAGISIDKERGGYAVDLEFTADGGKAFEDATRRIVNGQVVATNDQIPANAMMIVLDGVVQSAPVVEKIISGGNAQITGGAGGYTKEDASELALLIRGGALPAALHEVNSSDVAATLGIDALKMSIIAGVIGVLIIFVLMIGMYRIMGLAANIALLLYMLIVVWVMVALGSVLTLPGISGIILSIGMAVDANVIIFARIREEIMNGKSVRVSIDTGFKRAMATVVDSQITTMIAGIVLYQLGTGPVKGFAMTLMIGIVASVFTAVVVTNLYLSLMGENKRFGQKKYFGIKEAK